MKVDIVRLNGKWGTIRWEADGSRVEFEIAGDGSSYDAATTASAGLEVSYSDTPDTWDGKFER